MASKDFPLFTMQEWRYMCAKTSLPQRTLRPQRKNLKFSVTSVALHTQIATTHKYPRPQSSCTSHCTSTSQDRHRSYTPHRLLR